MNSSSLVASTETKTNHDDAVLSATNDGREANCSPTPPPASAPAAAPTDMKSPITVTEVEAMSVKQLKTLLIGRGVSTEGCVDKDDLIDKVISSNSAKLDGQGSPSSRPVGRTAAEELDERLAAAEESVTKGRAARLASEQDATREKTARQAAKAVSPGMKVDEEATLMPGTNDGQGANCPPAPSPASAPAAAPNDMKSPSTITEVGAMSVKQLKALLVRRGVSTEGCLDKDDLIDKVNSSSTPPASFVRAKSAGQLKQVRFEEGFVRTRTNSLPVLPTFSCILLTSMLRLSAVTGHGHKQAPQDYTSR